MTTRKVRLELRTRAAVHPSEVPLSATTELADIPGIYPISETQTVYLDGIAFTRELPFRGIPTDNQRLLDLEARVAAHDEFLTALTQILKAAKLNN
jgi:hypothetical protein